MATTEYAPLMLDNFFPMDSAFETQHFSDEDIASLEIFQYQLQQQQLQEQLKFIQQNACDLQLSSQIHPSPQIHQEPQLLQTQRLDESIIQQILGSNSDLVLATMEGLLFYPSEWSRFITTASEGLAKVMAQYEVSQDYQYDPEEEEEAAKETLELFVKI